MHIWQSFQEILRKLELFAEYSSTNIQILSYVPEKNSSGTTLDKFLTVLTTCQNVCRRSKKSTRKVRKKLQKNLFRTTRLPQQILWTRSKQFWFPCQNFPLGVWNSLWNLFFPNNPSSRKCNPGHVLCNFTTRAEKVSRKFEIFFAPVQKLV